jgi:hypothetical protein
MKDMHDETEVLALQEVKVAHDRWRNNRTLFPELTMDLAKKLRDMKDAHASDRAFSAALKAGGLGEDKLNAHDRRCLIKMADPDYEEVARELLAKTDRWSPQHIWLEEIEPELIARGIIKPKESKATKADASSEMQTTDDDNEPESPNDQRDAIDAIEFLGRTWSTMPDFEALKAALQDQETRERLANVDALAALVDIAELLQEAA